MIKHELSIKQPSPVQEGFYRRRVRIAVVTLLLLILTLLLCGTMLYLGNTRYSLGEIIRVLLGEQIKGATFAIGTLRLPRMLAGLLAGMAFGMAGRTFQTMLRNPLAS
ncbi:MAG: iron chelate uptake ABC transporter family permease subunit, partial [Desulfitobacterium hafniense]